MKEKTGGLIFLEVGKGLLYVSCFSFRVMLQNDEDCFFSLPSLGVVGWQLAVLGDGEKRFSFQPSVHSPFPLFLHALCMLLFVAHTLGRKEFFTAHAKRKSGTLLRFFLFRLSLLLPPPPAPTPSRRRRLQRSRVHPEPKHARDRPVVVAGGRGGGRDAASPASAPHPPPPQRRVRQEQQVRRRRPKVGAIQRGRPPRPRVVRVPTPRAEHGDGGLAGDV